MFFKDRNERQNIFKTPVKIKNKEFDDLYKIVEKFENHRSLSR